MRIFIALLVLLFLYAPQAKADIALSQLPITGTATITDRTPLVQSGPTDRTASLSVVFQAIAAGVDTICSVTGAGNICTGFFGYASPRWFGGYCDSNFNTNNNFHDDAAGILAAAGNSIGAPVLIPAPGCKIASQIVYNRHGIVLFTFAHAAVYNGTSSFGPGPIKPYIYVPDNVTQIAAINTNGYDSSGFFNLLVKAASQSGAMGASFVNRSGPVQSGESAQFSNFENVSCADMGTCLGYAVTAGTCNQIGVPNDNAQWYMQNVHVGQGCFGVMANATDNIFNMGSFSDMSAQCFGTFDNGGNHVGYAGTISNVRCEYSNFGGSGGGPTGSGLYYNSGIGIEITNYETDHTYLGPAIDIGPNAGPFKMTNSNLNASWLVYSGSPPNTAMQILIEGGAQRVAFNNVGITGSATQCGISIGSGVNYLSFTNTDADTFGTTPFCFTGTAPTHLNIQELGYPFTWNGQNFGVGLGTAAPASSVDFSGNTDALALQKGTTAQRTATPSTGMTRFNTSLNQVETYFSTLGWSFLQNQLVDAIASLGSQVPLIIQAFGDTALSTNIQAYYKLDDASGSTAVDAVAAQNGTWNGTLGSQWGTGIINGDGVFNGTDNYLSTTYTGVTGQSARTFSFWMKTTSTSCGTTSGVNVNIVGYSGANGFEVVSCIQSRGDRNGIGLVFGSFQYLYFNSATLQNGQWHHIAVVVPSGATQGGQTIFYQDGQPLTLTDSFNPTSAISATGTITFAGSSTSTNYWNGQIDEAGFWNRALSQAEVQVLYNNGLANQYPFLQQTANIVSISDHAGNSFAVVNHLGFLGIGTANPLAKLSVTGLGTSAPIGTTAGGGYPCMDAGGNLYGPKSTCP